MSTQTSTVAPSDVSTVPHEHRDPVAARIGMWLFLFTEVLLFGAMFIAYAMYLSLHRWDFQEASGHLNKFAGGINTAILLTSSLSMALAIAALARGKRGQSLGLMVVTIIFAVGFLIVKSFEWSQKFAHGLYPTSDTMAQMPPGEQVFYGLYYSMTGLHAFHVIIGAALILFTMWKVSSGKVHQHRMEFIENVGLYWHLVDLIWIFLFPLIYLIG